MVQGYVIKVMKIKDLSDWQGTGYVFDIIFKITYNI